MAAYRSCICLDRQSSAAGANLLTNRQAVARRWESSANYLINAFINGVPLKYYSIPWACQQWLFLPGVSTWCVLAEFSSLCMVCTYIVLSLDRLWSAVVNGGCIVQLSCSLSLCYGVEQ